MKIKFNRGIFFLFSCFYPHFKSLAFFDTFWHIYPFYFHKNFEFMSLSQWPFPYKYVFYYSSSSEQLFHLIFLRRSAQAQFIFPSSYEVLLLNAFFIFLEKIKKEIFECMHLHTYFFSVSQLSVFNTNKKSFYEMF